jgi:hypothetical protein
MIKIIQIIGPIICYTTNYNLQNKIIVCGLVLTLNSRTSAGFESPDIESYKRRNGHIDIRAVRGRSNVRRASAIRFCADRSSRGDRGYSPSRNIRRDYSTVLATLQKNMPCFAGVVE